MAGLALRSIWKAYGEVVALRNVSLKIEDGEFVVLVGPSGCGKSTLLSIIAGLEEPSHGSLVIGGRDVTDLAPKDRDIAMVFQSYALYPTMSVRENMTFGMQNRGVPKADQARAVRDVAALLQIDHLLDRKPSQLSGGQRQRVAMGRALVREPKLFLFDEPLSNLDAKLRIEMRTEIKRLHRKLGQTIVYVTHDQVEAMTLSDRIVVMQGGIVQQCADPDTIYHRPANLFVAGFMGSPSMNVLPAEVVAASEGPTLRLAPTLALPAAGLARGLREGRRVMVGLRPEHFCLPDAMGPRDVAVEAGVEVVEPTGPETMLALDLAGHEVVAMLPAAYRPRPGERVHLGLRLPRAHLFDPDTTLRLGAD